MFLQDDLTLQPDNWDRYHVPVQAHVGRDTVGGIGLMRHGGA